VTAVKAIRPRRQDDLYLYRRSASLELIEGKELPGVAALTDK
jgi:hypothetical protein